MCNLWFKKKRKKTFTFSSWCYYTFTVTVSYVITWEWWFCMYFLHAENFSLSTKSNLMHIAPWSEDDLRQLSKLLPMIPIFERNEIIIVINNTIGNFSLLFLCWLYPLQRVKLSLNLSKSVSWVQMVRLQFWSFGKYGLTLLLLLLPRTLWPGVIVPYRVPCCIQ